MKDVKLFALAAVFVKIGSWYPKFSGLKASPVMTKTLIWVFRFSGSVSEKMGWCSSKQLFQLLLLSKYCPSSSFLLQHSIRGEYEVFLLSREGFFCASSLQTAYPTYTFEIDDFLWNWASWISGTLFQGSLQGMSADYINLQLIYERTVHFWCLRVRSAVKPVYLSHTVPKSCRWVGWLRYQSRSRALNFFLLITLVIQCL